MPVEQYCRMVVCRAPDGANSSYSMSDLPFSGSQCQQYRALDGANSSYSMSCLPFFWKPMSAIRICASFLLLSYCIIMEKIVEIFRENKQ